MDANHQSTDGSSIKPVSSLRSHFEKMTSVKSANAVPTVQHQNPVLSHVKADWRPSLKESRSSLDVPRMSSPWEPPNETKSPSRPVSPLSKLPPKPIARLRDSDVTIRQRPLSMGQLSPPPKPPIKPRSRNPSPSKIAQQADQVPISKTSTLTSRKATYEGSPINLTQVSQHAGSEKLPVSKEAGPVANVPPLITDRGVWKDHSIPPPMNRTKKPKPPSKPPMVHGSQGKPGPEPSLAECGGRQSPFLKLPGSVLDDNSMRNHGKPLESKETSLRVDHHPSLAKPKASNESGLDDKQFLGLESPKSLRTNGNDVVNYDDGQRPGLPPRPRQRPPSSATRSGDSRNRPLANEHQTRYHFSQIAAHPNNTQFASPSNSRNLRIPETSSSEFTALPKSGTPFLGPVDLTTTDCSGQQYDTQTIRGGSPFGTISSSDYPDASQSNRRPPKAHKCASAIETKYDTRLFDVCGKYVCATGYLTRAWDVTTGELVFQHAHNEKETKVTSIAFKSGGLAEDEGKLLWLGTNYGELYEADIPNQEIVQRKPGAHAHREIIKIYRYQNCMWSLDDDGRFCVWPPDDTGSPNLSSSPEIQRIHKGHTFSMVVNGYLWLATGKEIRIYNPSRVMEPDFQVTQLSFSQPSAGEITSGAIISTQLDRVYFGHADGKVTTYSTRDYSCIGVYNVSAYKINCLAGAGFYLWAGFNTGMIYVYDTRSQPWLVKKDWLAHENPVSGVLVDRTSVWKHNCLHIVSLAIDNVIRIWDGLLEEDWLEAEMQSDEGAYCNFHEISSIVVSWNAGATTPSSLRNGEKHENFFREVINPSNPPDLLVFGFQELVDLDDKRLTAKSLFLGSKKKDSSEQEHMSRQYRAWRDYLVRVIEDCMPPTEPYHLLHTASLVGLFSCVFIKASHQNHVKNLHAAEVKRGIGGLHGNKGALIMRFTLEDTSLCFTNCHLAAGQSQTMNRNNDIAAILESALLPPEKDPEIRLSRFIDGGDGSMIMDHEICILNGDLNYRIDTMGRDTVIKAVKSNNLQKLLERDQLLVSKRRNPSFRLRSFTELPITFAPTYKYDVGTDRYDTSEKGRSPAWCDRLLFRGAARVTQLSYQRHELRVSDHRPVSGTFKLRIKATVPEQRERVWQACNTRVEMARKQLIKEIQVDYLVSVLGTNLPEARRLVDID